MFVAGAVLLPAAPALGHAAYKGSDPPDGGRVGSPPSRVTAEFTEPLAGGSYLQVTDPCGKRVDAGDVSITGYTMSVSMNGDAAGRYVVFYRAHSQLDPHVTQGEFDFSASQGERCPGSEPEREVAAAPETGGGGGGGGGSAGASTGSGTGSANTAPASSASDAAQSGNNGSGNRSSGATSSSRRDRSGFQPKRATVPNIAAAPERESETKSVWDGIRLESFLTGLMLAAIIGAAGGKIYAGIMGPRA